MKNTLQHIWKNAPIYLGIILVIVNALIDSGTIALPTHLAFLINAILAAFGLGVLHVRQQSTK
jgi:hypothetical protein